MWFNMHSATFGWYNSIFVLQHQLWLSITDMHFDTLLNSIERPFNYWQYFGTQSRFYNHDNTLNSLSPMCIHTTATQINAYLSNECTGFINTLQYVILDGFRKFLHGCVWCLHSTHEWHQWGLKKCSKLNKKKTKQIHRSIH
jgi:hypothetical protein